MGRIKTFFFHIWAMVGIGPTRFIRWFTMVSLCSTMAGCAIGIFVALDASYNDRQRAEQALTNLAVALELAINDEIILWDFSLQKYIQSKTRSDIDYDLQNVEPSSIPATGEDMDTFMTLNAHGNAVDTSVPLGPDLLSFADHDSFLVHQQRTEVGLYFSQPFRNHPQNREMSVAISRRLPSDDGRFQGVALGILSLTHFEHLFKSIETGSQGSVTVFRFAGGSFLDYPINVADVRNGSINALSNAELIQASSGSFVASDGLNGMKRLHVFRRIGKLPLLLDVAMLVNGTSKTWNTVAIPIGSILFAFCCINLVLCRLLYKEHAWRLRRESQLVSIVCEKFAAERSRYSPRRPEPFDDTIQDVSIATDL